MIRQVLKLSAPSLMALYLSSCNENIAVASRSPDSQVIVYEGRKSGAGTAPDSVKVYLTIAGKPLTNRNHPILEGQDLSAICYSWKTSKDLDISISSGYIDQVAQRWTAPDGHLVMVHYLGTNKCDWREPH